MNSERHVISASYYVLFFKFFVGTDTNNNYETLTLTEIGISFYEACNYVNNI